MTPIRYFFIPGFLFIVFLISCSPAKEFRKDKALFDASPVIIKYKAIADMNDAFFVLKKNNFFEFYRQLFDSVKNTSYPGRYTKSGDTLHLNFYDKKGADILGRKALINQQKKEIIFFDTDPAVKKKLILN